VLEICLSKKKIKIKEVIKNQAIIMSYAVKFIEAMTSKGKLK
jgi:hypothetical protein